MASRFAGSMPRRSRMAMNNIGMSLDVGQTKQDVDGATVPALPPDPANSTVLPKAAKKGGKQGVGIIKRIRSMKGVGILSNRGAKDRGQVFQRFNLVYGFNGSGKSTLSLACSPLFRRASYISCYLRSAHSKSRWKAARSFPQAR